MLFNRACSLPQPPFPLVAVDTETCRFEEPRYDPNRKTRHTPFIYPELILGSLATLDTVSVLRADDFLADLQRLLHEGYGVCFHNVAFDWYVIHRACASLPGPRGPQLRAALFKAVDENRVHDTQILEQLIQIARGSQTIDQKVLRSPSLADLAKRRAGMDLLKDDSVRLNFEDYRDPAYPLPQAFLEYAAADAEATYRVFCSQWKEALLYADPPPDCSYPVLADARPRFGPLTESIQVKGALALKWLEQFPLRVDLAEVESVRRRLSAESLRLQEALVSFGFARVTPKRREFKLSHKKLRALLSEYAAGRTIVAPRSSSGLLSLTYDFWAQVLPRLGTRLLASPSDARGLEEQAAVWLRYCRVHKLLATYIQPYSTNPEHYPTYHNIGARTGRTSCVRPNIQNIPKRKDGIRSLFVPREGHVLIEGDYRAAELVALAQVYKLLYGGSVLGDDINAGLDIHAEVARRLKGNSVPWPSNTIPPLRAYYDAAQSQNQAAGSTEASPEKDMVEWKLVETTGASTEQPSSSGLERFLTGSSFVIPATTLSALIQNTSFLAQLSTTKETALRRAADTTSPLTLQALEALIGKEAFLWIITNTCGSAGPVSKQERQMAKAISFGLPGGLGASKFQIYANKSYGLTLSENEARDLRRQALGADPQLCAYLADGRDPKAHLTLASRNLGLSLHQLLGALRAWRDEDAGEPHWELAVDRLRKWSFGDDRFTLAVPPGFDRRWDLLRTTSVSPAGFVRGRASFTEAHNLPFQSLVACGAKLAAWNLYRSWSDQGQGWWAPVAFVHDSFLIEVWDNKDCISIASNELKHSMIGGLMQVCPDIRVEVDVTPPLARWGTSTNPLGAPTG